MKKIRVTYNTTLYDNNRQNVDPQNAQSIYFENQSDATVYLWGNTPIAAGEWFELENSDVNEFIAEPVPYYFSSSATTFKLLVIRKFAKEVIL